MENIFVSTRRRKAMRLTQIAATAINRLVPGPLKKGCKSLLYNLTKTLWTDNTPLPSVEEAYALLNSVSPDPDNSCIRQNKILEPDCDLQIIVPVYNVEKYVEECIDSILNQETEFTFKIVIINDGSPDRSREILKNTNHSPTSKSSTKKTADFPEQEIPAWKRFPDVTSCLSTPTIFLHPAHFKNC